jgi:hypothetical protein
MKFPLTGRTWTSRKVSLLLLLASTLSPPGGTGATAIAAEQDTSASRRGNPDADEGKVRPVAAPGGLSRWLEVRPAGLAVRYRHVDNGPAGNSIDQLQHRQVFQGRLKFDPRGDYALNAAVLSGNTFTGSWNNTGIGTGKPVTNLHLEQLFLSAQPIAGLEIRYGGLPIVQGESTEITSYDNDGYLVGERLHFRRPKDLFFDEIVVTFGYLGDFARPNLNKRFHRLKESNYHQFLVGRRIGRRVAVTADYTFHAGVETLRQAVRIRTPAARVLDAVRFENYERVDVDPAYGFAITGDKALSGRLLLSAGWASIDPDYGLVNGDRYFRGKRLFAALNIGLFPGWTVSLYGTRAFESGPVTPNRVRFDAVLNYDLARGLAGILGANP